MEYRSGEKSESSMPERSDTLVRDRLARQRTELANERTLLSYIRTALGFFAVGVPAVWWMEGLGFQSLGVVSLVTGLLFLGVGVWRFVIIKRGVDRQLE
jgi:putative membrane protein